MAVLKEYTPDGIQVWIRIWAFYITWYRIYTMCTLCLLDEWYNSILIVFEQGILKDYKGTILIDCAFDSQTLKSNYSEFDFALI